MGRAGAILLVVSFVTGALLASGSVVVESSNVRTGAVFFIIAGCVVGAALLTASFARSSLKYYKARAERRQH
jgi:hypothetical protein